ncbi:hypothetical protein [Pseudoalteromonas phenolica]|uniref:hypothetical protein n=1 Tax=Pseudoalteromonas phenolica TaxID=161398 RepID=UPI00110C036C|nr:hypothetical protein [Pseudoalteromonas phenolica]TMO56994.1 hypothetical protein CWC21_03645 [Pseudoalteromonas phenolica]
MKTFDKYTSNLEKLVNSHPKNLPRNILAANSFAKWTDSIWYYKDEETGIKHRYLFSKAVKGNRRSSFDVSDSPNLPEPYSSLLKIYMLEVQHSNIVNNSKQYRVVVGSQILTEAEKLGGLNFIPMDFWNKTPASNLFWDFCKKHHLIMGRKRPTHTDRERSADISYLRSEDQLKVTPTSLIYALGDIFTKVFKDIDENGKVCKDGIVNLDEAIAITTVLLGLASPNRSLSEVPLLQNQLLKVLKPENGEVVYYLDWPGSKGYLDNQNHILRALSPQVKKAINFFSSYLAPERHFVRYLKNTNQTWNEILRGFEVEKERLENINFDIPPNIFSVSYALGFYPIEYEVETLISSDVVVLNNGHSKWRFKKNSWCKEKKRTLTKKDFLNRKKLAQVHSNDLILNMVGSSKALYSIRAFLNCRAITKESRERLNLPILVTVAELEKAITRLLIEHIPKFPVSYTDSEKGLDLESALFCFSPAKHSVNLIQGLSGSPLYIMPLNKIRHLITHRLNITKKPSKNLFYIYGYGRQHLKLHSLRHFANTQAEKGGIPLSIISAWSGRKSINQTIDYIHTSEDEKADRLINVLDYNDLKNDIKVITKDEISKNHGLPASVTETGICTQELTVTPCNYINSFLSGCLLCENSCYVCGDSSSINILEQDLKFQKYRLLKIRKIKSKFLSDANKDWWVQHSQSVRILEELIKILKEHETGLLVRFASHKACFFITDLNEKRTDEILLSLPTESELLKALEVELDNENTIPDDMESIIASFGLKSIDKSDS